MKRVGMILAVSGMILLMYTKDNLASFLSFVRCNGSEIYPWLLIAAGFLLLNSNGKKSHR